MGFGVGVTLADVGMTLDEVNEVGGVGKVGEVHEVEAPRTRAQLGAGRDDYLILALKLLLWIKD